MSGKNIIYKLNINNLEAGYPNKSVLSDVTFQLSEGEIVTLIGPNGAGKTTLLKTLARQLAPVAGTVYLDQRQIHQFPDREYDL